MIGCAQELCDEHAATCTFDNDGDQRRGGDGDYANRV